MRPDAKETIRLIADDIAAHAEMPRHREIAEAIRSMEFAHESNPVYPNQIEMHVDTGEGRFVRWLHVPSTRTPTREVSEPRVTAFAVSNGRTVAYAPCVTGSVNVMTPADANSEVRRSKATRRYENSLTYAPGHADKENPSDTHVFSRIPISGAFAFVTGEAVVFPVHRPPGFRQRATSLQPVRMLLSMMPPRDPEAPSWRLTARM